jgi:type III secretion protein T
MGLGLMNRFVPQLNIFFFSMPVKSALTFLLLIFYITTIVWGMDRDMFTEDSLLGFVKGLFR